MPPTPSRRSDPGHLLFEAAWEVANKVGGIYTVIRSKAPVTVAEYGSRYCLIGPWYKEKAASEVEPIDWMYSDIHPSMKDVFMELRLSGISFIYGRWLVEGGPRVLLLDLNVDISTLNDWKGSLWNIAGIPTPDSDIETNNAVIFGFLTAQFLEKLSASDKDRAIILHSHEWQAGVPITLCRKRRLGITTIFTTHATLLGRYLCAGSIDFYNTVAHVDVDYEAGSRGIYHRYCIERSAAHCADVFTTVSHITAFEAEHLLKRRPDGVLPNGLNVKRFSAVHEFQNMHQMAKQRIHDFVRGHFYGYFDFDLEDTLYFFTAGRSEYRNKGIDMYIESLHRLDYELKAAQSNTTVVAFIIVPADIQSYTVESLKGQAVMKQLKDTVNQIQQRVGDRLFDRTSRSLGDASKASVDIQSLLSDEDKILLKRSIISLKRDGLPPITTHNLRQSDTDPILNHIRRVQLFNRSADRVKIIYHPEFLNANNPILPLDYEDFVRGCHLGVFPSYYEPWGYTPAECTVMGVPSITTNLSGFGCYIDELIDDSADYGIFIVDRLYQSVEDSLNQIVHYMLDFCSKTRRQRIALRNRTERVSELLDWKRMGLDYSKARHLALKRTHPGIDFSEGEQQPRVDVDSPRTLFASLTPRRANVRLDNPRSVRWQSLFPPDHEDEDTDSPSPLRLKVSNDV